MRGLDTEVHLMPYNPGWKIAFQNERKELEQLFGRSVSVHHIGSTSIPGCYAKPIIDILGVTNNLFKIDAYNSSLEEKGYTPLGEYGMKWRRFFRRVHGLSVNLHIFEDSDPEVIRHLRFRDYLIDHPQNVREYSTLKKELAAQFPNDGDRYTLGKCTFIKEIDYRGALGDCRGLRNHVHSLKRKEWSRDEILDAMKANLHTQLTYFPKYIPGMDQIFEPDVTVVRGMIPDDTFNFVIDAQFIEGALSERVCHVLSYFGEKTQPFSWWVRDIDFPECLENELMRQGLSFRESNVGMYLSLKGQKFETKNTKLSFSQALEGEHLHDFSRILVNVGGYGAVYEELYSKIPSSLYDKGNVYQIYVGYLDHIPVVAGILVLHAQVAGIYYIMTDPAYRRRGFGTEIMFHLLNRAKEQGYYLSTLQASAQGVVLYRKLGYSSICLYKEYVPKQECS